MPLLTILGAFLLLVAGIVTIAVLPWWVIITIGLIADVIAFTTGFIPLFGDFFGAAAVAPKYFDQNKLNIKIRELNIVK